MMKECETHQMDLQKSISLPKAILLKEDNKISCQNCVSCYSQKIEEEAKQNAAKYVEMHSNIINTNNEMKQKYIKKLNELQERLNQYFQKQQQSITSLIEQQNQILTQNINKANSILNQQLVLDSQLIDNFITFMTLNEENQQIIKNNYNQINNCLERQFNYEFTEIVYSVNQFINTEFKFDIVPIYGIQEFEIQTFDKLRDQQSYCKQHKLEKSFICTQKDCLVEKKQEKMCFLCAVSIHQDHKKKGFVDHLKQIKVQQSEKLKKIELHKSEIDRIIDDELAAIQQNQQETFQSFQRMRKQLKVLEAQTKIDPFNNNPKFNINSIDWNLLPYDLNMIKQQVQSKQKELSYSIQQEEKKLINQIKSAINNIQNKKSKQTSNMQSLQYYIIGILIISLTIGMFSSYMRTNWQYII